MLTLIGILLVLWLVLAIFGFVVKGLLWLALIAARAVRRDRDLGLGEPPGAHLS